ncbi:MAG: hypothetical protein ABI652_06070, partial [Acidobacteriota bacterium]
GALPDPAVPAYSELTLRAARALGSRFAVEVIGDNLLHRRHLEFLTQAIAREVPRSVFVRLTWTTR